MNPDFSKTLWSDPERSRFFLIPDDLDLPAGKFELRTVTGRQRDVDEAALPEFEISRDKAKIWLKEQFGQILTTAKTGIMDSLKNWSSPQPTSQSDASPGEAKTTTPKSRTEKALSELEALLSQSAEQLRAKSAMSLGRLQAIADALNGMFEGSISSAPDGLERAKAQSQTLQDNLEALGIHAGDQLKTLPERLHTLYFAEGQSQNFQENAAQLDAIADQIESTATLAVSSIRAMAQQQRKHATQSKQKGHSQP